MTIGLGRNGTAFGPHRLSRNRIDGKGELTEHGIQTRRQISPRHQIENIVGAVAQGYLRGRYRITRRQRLLEFKAITVGVTGQLRQRRLNGRQHLTAGTQRVLVTGQFDDTGRIEIELARQFVHRLTGHIGRQLLYARLGQGEKITAHD